MKENEEELEKIKKKTRVYKILITVQIFFTLLLGYIIINVVIPEFKNPRTTKPRLCNYY